MTLFELTSRNVKRNFRLYTIYFVAMIVSVMIYFTFVSLTYNDTILATLEYSENFQLGMLVASTVTLIFIAVFVMYANGFFMRHRKKELGMYLVLGMREKQVTAMIFYENLIIGAVSLLIGCLVGTLLSKFFAMAILRLMVYHVPIELSFSFAAVLQTSLVFLVLTLIISFQAYMMIRRVKLKDLFQSAQMSEKPMKVSWTLSILSILLLGAAYYSISRGWGSTLWSDHTGLAMIVTATGILGGTYLFFRQFIAFVLLLLSKTRRYVESERMLWLYSICYQVRGNATNLTFIALFSCMLLFFVAFVSLNYMVQLSGTNKVAPNSFAYHSVSAAKQEQVDQLIEESGFKQIFHETVSTVPAKPVSGFDIVYRMPEMANLESMVIVSQSAYNHIVDLRGDKEQIEVTGNTAYSLSQGIEEIPGEVFEPTEVEIRVGEEPIKLVIQEKKDYALLGENTGKKMSLSERQTVLVVNDELYRSLASAVPELRFELYALENDKMTADLSDAIYEAVHQESSYFSSFVDLYSVQIESSSALLFGSCFLALIAVFALASIIYFKQMREATEARGRYQILQKIGIAAKTVKATIRKQMVFVFFPPLLIGVSHSLFILKYYILDLMPEYEFTGILATILAIYIVIYSLFYFSAVRVYYTIIRERA